MKRALSFILSLLMLFGTLAFASCSNGTTPAATTPALTQPTAGGDVTDPAETTVAPAVCPVAEEDYDGHEFLILEGTFSLVTCIYDFTYQSENPTILDDAVFKRNSSVEDRLNVTIASKNVVCKSTTGSTEGYGVMMREKTAPPPAPNTSATRLKSKRPTVSHTSAPIITSVNAIIVVIFIKNSPEA